MSFYETIGWIWIAFTSLLGTVTIGHFFWRGITSAKRQRDRGHCEETLDIRRATQDRFIPATERVGR